MQPQWLDSDIELRCYRAAFIPATLTATIPTLELEVMQHVEKSPVKRTCIAVNNKQQQPVSNNNNHCGKHTKHGRYTHESCVRVKLCRGIPNMQNPKWSVDNWRVCDLAFGSDPSILEASTVNL